MTKRNKTSHIRVRKELRDIFNRDFPGIPHSNLVDIAFKTSPLNLESHLRTADRKLDDLLGIKKNVKKK